MASITALSLIGYDATSLAHLYFGSFSHSSLQILSSSQALSGSQVGWDIFRAFHRFSSPVSDGTLKDIQTLVQKPLLLCLGCVLRVIVLLSCWNAANTILHRRDGARFPPDVMLGIKGQRVESWFYQTRESCFSWSESPLGSFWQTTSGRSCAFY